MRVIRVLFVCHGNICRSPLAEFVMRELVRRAGLSEEIEVDSKACRTDELGSDTHPGTQRVLREHGIPFTRRAAQLIRAEDYERYDLIIAMDAENMRNLDRLTGGDPASKCHLLMSYSGEERDVADPWYTGDFHTTYDDVYRGCQDLLASLTSGQQPGSMV